jgi:N-ethylmaleimide reductase
MKHKSLFDPIAMGNSMLKNRIVMAPMTRSRAEKNGVSSDIAIEYYQQRSNACLIITECTPLHLIETVIRVCQASM